VSVKVVLVDTIIYELCTSVCDKVGFAKPLQGMEMEVVVAHFTVLLQLWLMKEIKLDSSCFRPGIEPGTRCLCILFL